MVADGGAKSAGGGVCTASSCPLYNSEEAYLIVESGHPWSRVVSSSIRGGTDHVEWIGFILVGMLVHCRTISQFKQLRSDDLFLVSDSSGASSFNHFPQFNLLINSYDFV